MDIKDNDDKNSIVPIGAKDEWRVVFYPNGGFYMIWRNRDLFTNWKEYLSRASAQNAIDRLNSAVE